ncbi:iron-containing redox enzyme family protein, partial [Jatrophihabitans endophyticus]|uniref:iron-containing redox enzyme family protein n=1 Tax=Jatrophihabitans endophyticus TaxID=1206085 RepID=UPI0019F52C4B
MSELLPRARGTFTQTLFDALRSDDAKGLPRAPDVEEPLVDDEFQLALWVCYELHYRGFRDVSDEWEWRPELIELRSHLESAHLNALRDAVDVGTGGASVPDRVWRLVTDDDAPSVARFVQRQASREQVLELAAHRSIYQLKEADPHTWAIPRLAGRSKAALVEIQADEYGQGQLHRMHSELFAKTLRGLGLDDSYAAYVDAVPGVTLSITNTISLFGLHRALVGALVGHLAAYEMTSSAPSRS